jgi:hypothetical protein
VYALAEEREKAALDEAPRSRFESRDVEVDLTKELFVAEYPGFARRHRAKSYAGWRKLVRATALPGT